MQHRTGWILSAVLLATSASPLALSSAAQDRHDDRRDNGNNQFYNGARGQRPYDDSYDRNRYNDNNGNNRYNNGDNRYNNGDNRYNNGDYNRRHQGGIGPGKGALIGGAGGAALGAIFGGGMKGALIGGGVGAGGGALIGKAAQNRRYNNQDNGYNNRDYRDRR